MEQYYRKFRLSAIPVPNRESGWRAKGIVFNPHTHRVLKWFQTPDVIFGKKEEAEACALQLCKDWIDGSFGKTRRIQTALQAACIPPKEKNREYHS